MIEVISDFCKVCQTAWWFKWSVFQKRESPWEIAVLSFFFWKMKTVQFSTSFSINHLHQFLPYYLNQKEENKNNPSAGWQAGYRTFPSSYHLTGLDAASTFYIFIDFYNLGALSIRGIFFSAISTWSWLFYLWINIKKALYVFNYLKFVLL